MPDDTREISAYILEEARRSALGRPQGPTPLAQARLHRLNAGLVQAHIQYMNNARRIARARRTIGHLLALADQIEAAARRAA